MSPVPAVFLDRDGVVTQEAGYVSQPDALAIAPGAPASLRMLTAAGFRLVVVTNQSAVARGLLTEAALQSMHRSLEAQLTEQGVRIDGWFYCPHHPAHGAPPYRQRCTCRKPAPGMLLHAARLLSLDLERSYLIGDKRSDVAAAHGAGCRSVLVRTGHGAREAERAPSHAGEIPHHIADTPLLAAAWIVGELDLGQAHVEREPASHTMGCGR